MFINYQFDHENPFGWARRYPIMLIYPEEITTTPSKQFREIIKGYSLMNNALPPHQKKIVDISVLTNLKMWAYKCQSEDQYEDPAFVIGIKEFKEIYGTQRFVEIGILDFGCRKAMKISSVEFDGNVYISKYVFCSAAFLGGG